MTRGEERNQEKRKGGERREKTRSEEKTRGGKRRVGRPALTSACFQTTSLGHGPCCCRMRTMTALTPTSAASPTWALRTAWRRNKLASILGGPLSDT